MPGVRIEEINAEILPVSVALSGVTTTPDGKVPTADSEISGYQISDMDTAGTTQYFGFVNANGEWYILEITATAVRYCKGTTDYAGNWTDRQNLSYGYYNVIF
jgi:hypothetical protein